MEPAEWSWAMNRRKTGTLCFIFVGLAIVVAFGDESTISAMKSGPRRFELTDLGNIVQVGDPRIAPDGRSIVIVVSRSNYKQNRMDSELVVGDIASGKQRVLTLERESVAQPRWSPTGDRLAFLAKGGGEGNVQIHVMPMNGSDARRITAASESVQHFAWNRNHARSIDCSTAMGEVRKAYPDDADIGALTAEAMMDLRRGQPVTPVRRRKRLQRQTPPARARPGRHPHPLGDRPAFKSCFPGHLRVLRGVALWLGDFGP
jgi:hypothetical protein